MNLQTPLTAPAIEAVSVEKTRSPLALNTVNLYGFLPAPAPVSIASSMKFALSERAVIVTLGQCESSVLPISELDTLEREISATLTDDGNCCAGSAHKNMRSIARIPRDYAAHPSAAREQKAKVRNQ